MKYMPTDLQVDCQTCIIGPYFSGLQTGECGFIQDDNKENRSFCRNSFTVYTKLFLSKSIKQQQYILIHQSKTRNTVQLYFELQQHCDQDQKCECDYCLSLELCGVLYKFQNTFGTNQWFDIMIIYQSQQLDLYVDGTYLQTINEIKYDILDPDIIMIGNNPEKQGANLEGYIQQVVIFSKSLGQDDAEYFYANGINAFEADVDSFYDFSSAKDTISEFVHSTELIAKNGAQIITNISNNYKHVTGNYRSPANVADLTNEQRKEARTFLEIYLQYLTQILGIRISLTIQQNEVMETQLYTKYSSYTSIQVAQPEIQNYQSVLKTLGKMKEMLSLFVKFSPLIIKLEVLKEMFLIGCVLGGISAITSFSQMVIMLIQNIYKREYPDYDTIKITLDNVIFNHCQDDCSISGINILNQCKNGKSNEDNSIAVQWIGANKPQTPTNIAYVKSNITKNAMLQITINIIPHLTKIQFILNCSSFLFGENNVQFNNQTTANLTLSNNILNKAPVGTIEQSIVWWVELSNGRRIDLGISYHNIHIINKICVSPWSIKEQHSFPNVDTLNLFNKLYKNNKQDNDHDDNMFMTILSKSIYCCDKFKARTDNQNSYSNVGMVNCEGYETRIVFDAQRLIKDFKTNSSQIYLSSLDACLLLTDLARLQGISNINPICLEQNLPYVYYQEIQSYKPQMFTLENVKLIGEQNSSQIITQLWSHYCVTKDYNIQKYDFLCYDSYLKKENETQSFETDVNGMQFSTNSLDFVVFSDVQKSYRETIFSESSFCEIISLITQYAKEQVDGVLMNQMICLNLTQKQYFQRSQNDRPRLSGVFDTDQTLIMRKCQYCQSTITNRCHLISFETIADTVYSYLNEVFKTPENIINGLQIYYWEYINSFIDTILGPVEFYNQCTKGEQNIITAAKIIWAKFTSMYENKEDAIEKSQIDTLNKHLLSSRYNIRIGDAKWNSAIGQQFDVENWCYIQKEQEIWYVISSDDMSSANPIPLAEYGGFEQKPTNDQVKQGFYLRNLNPWRRNDYTIWSSIGIEVVGNKQIKLCIPIFLYTSQEYGQIPCIKSSSNSFAYQEGFIQFNSKVYYLSPNNEWVSLGYDK
ncbi:Conserved_hypothetical protein [Hexamita inflata]|uniref:Uncharacterized protein n=1 Tax=Hexamita inflata TaxID=28002 RepID=A0AA86QAT9_9EUKA|nr:Conserved hypothetical protein [Hexamita inflata]